MNKYLSTIFFYLRAKRFTIKSMLAMSSPISEDKTEDARISYGIYFNSILSLISFSKENIENLTYEKLSELENSLIDVVGSNENYHYIRELRNSIIHRGYDVFRLSYMNGSILVPVSPSVVSNINNSKSYYSFTPDLFELVKIIENINPLIYSYCEKHNILGFEPINEEQIKIDIQNDLYIPNYVKKLAQSTQIDVDVLNDELMKKYERNLKLLFDTSDLFIKVEQTHDIH